MKATQRDRCWRPTLPAMATAVVYMASEAFNLLATMPRADEVFEAFGDMAWLPPSEGLIEKAAIPGAKPFAVVPVVGGLVILLATALRTRGPRPWPAGGPPDERPAIALSAGSGGP
jgi:hypothetical protein